MRINALLDFWANKQGGSFALQLRPQRAGSCRFTPDLQRAAVCSASAASQEPPFALSSVRRGFRRRVQSHINYVCGENQTRHEGQRPLWLLAALQWAQTQKPLSEAPRATFKAITRASTCNLASCLLLKTPQNKNIMWINRSTPGNGVGLAPAASNQRAFFFFFSIK